MLKLFCAVDWNWVLEAVLTVAFINKLNIVYREQLQISSPGVQTDVWDFYEVRCHHNEDNVASERIWIMYKFILIFLYAIIEGKMKYTKSLTN